MKSKLLKIMHGFFYLFFFFIVITLIAGPFFVIREITVMLSTGIPSGTDYFFIIGFCSLILFISISVRRYHWIYEKFPILWPALQMGLFMFIAFGLGATFINAWAENNIPTKSLALFLSLFSFLVARALMSYWFYRYPAAAPFNSRRVSHE
ncbi:hypothetical protein BTS2_1769 [Bacillus sp. TS-2]|nr:hypothetical protein BTS2_1769 [Bacillus sp. TS-2]